MKQKGVYYCLGSLLMLTVMFTGCYYISYKVALSQFNRRSIEHTREYAKINENVPIENVQAKVEEEKQSYDVVPVDLTQIQKVKPSTKYQLKETDLSSGETTETESNPPAQFIGLTKKEIVDYLDSYMNDMTLSDYEKGLISYDLLSFSEEAFQIEKIYDASQVKYKYYVCIYNNFVTVYYSDLKTVFEYTMINAQNLPEKDRVDLSKGIYIQDEVQLYSLLESLSS